MQPRTIVVHDLVITASGGSPGAFLRIVLKDVRLVGQVLTTTKRFMG